MVPVANVLDGFDKTILVIAEVTGHNPTVRTTEPEPLRSEFSVVKQVL